MWPAIRSRSYVRVHMWPMVHMYVEGRRHRHVLPGYRGFEFDPPLVVLLTDATRLYRGGAGGCEKGWLTVTDDRCPESNTYTHWTSGQSIVSCKHLRNIPPAHARARARVSELRACYTIVIRGCTGHGYRREMSHSLSSSNDTGRRRSSPLTFRHSLPPCGGVEMLALFVKRAADRNDD